MKSVLNILTFFAKLVAVLAVLLAVCFVCRGKMLLQSKVPAEKLASSVTGNDIIEASEYKPQIGTYGGEFHVGMASQPKSFNPITSGETTTTVFTDRIFLGLTRADNWTYLPVPELATGWQADESGLVWIVTLRKGVLWSDGEPFTADDVLFTYKTIYDQRYVCSTRDGITGPNGETWKLRKIDDHTVEFTLYDKNAIFPLLLSTSIIPEHKYKELVDSGKFNEALNANTPPEEIVGTGPFILEKFEPSRQVVLKRNPHYYRRDAAGNQLPYLDRVVYVICQSVDVMMLKFKQGDTDIFGLRGEDYPDLSQLSEELNYRLYRLGPASGSSFVFFNVNPGMNPNSNEPLVAPYKLKWFNDVRFRRAISHLIDRDFIVRGILNGLGYPQYGPLNKEGNYFYGHPDIPKFPYDPEKAKKLFEEMGLIDRDGDGFREDADGHKVQFSLMTSSNGRTRQDIASLIRQDMVAAGLDVNTRPVNFNALVSRLDTSAGWECCLLGLTGGPEPHWGSNVWKSSGRMHLWYPSQPEPATVWEAELDKIFADGARELDLEKRREIYYRWQEIIGQQQPFMYTATSEVVVALRNGFGNIFPAQYNPQITHNLDEIYVLDKSGDSQGQTTVESEAVK